MFQLFPYCYINVVTYLLGGSWYIYCDLIGKTAATVANDFQQALHNIGPSSRVADYRSLWMMLSRIIRDVGDAFGYAMIFLCLYLFLIITLTTYGLLSQIQKGLGMKDIGLAITAFCAGTMLFFISDKAHYASNKVSFYKEMLWLKRRFKLPIYTKNLQKLFFCIVKYIVSTCNWTIYTVTLVLIHLAYTLIILTSPYQKLFISSCLVTTF